MNISTVICKRSPYEFWTKVSAATLIFSTLLSGCQNINTIPTPQPTIGTTTPTPTPKSTPTDTVVATATPSPSPTPTSLPTPSSTIEMSSEGDLYRKMDPQPITEKELNGGICLGTVEMAGVTMYEAYMELPKNGVPMVKEYFTGNDTFIGGDTYIPTDFMIAFAKGKSVKFVGFNSIYAFLINVVKMSEKEAKDEISKLKTGKDFRELLEKIEKEKGIKILTLPGPSPVNAMEAPIDDTTGVEILTISNDSHGAKVYTFRHIDLKYTGVNEGELVG